MNRDTLTGLTLVLTLTACVAGPEGLQPGVSSEVRNAVAACGGGLTSSTKATLVGALEDSGGNLTAEVKQEMKAVILRDENITESNALEVYRIYEGCISRML